MRCATSVSQFGEKDDTLYTFTVTQSVSKSKSAIAHAAVEIQEL